jgi:hypothetical protein
MQDVESVLKGFVVEARHLTCQLNVVTSDMIRDRKLAEKLDNEPAYFQTEYDLSDGELTAMRDRDLLKLFELGLHPFLLVRFAGMMGILEYWQELGAPGRAGDGLQND